MTRWLKFTHFIALALITTSCIQFGQNSEEIEVLTFNASPCFGSCPSYTVDIFSDGLVIFKGELVSSPVGVKKWHESPDLFKNAKAAFIKADIGSIDILGCGETYVTDHPSVIINLATSKGVTGSAHDYGCTGYEGEERMLKLINDIRTLLPIGEWIKEQ